MATVYHNGHALTGSWNQRLLGNQRTRVYRNSKADSLTFGVESHVWNRTYAQVLKSLAPQNFTGCWYSVHRSNKQCKTGTMTPIQLPASLVR